MTEFFLCDQSAPESVLNLGYASIYFRPAPAFKLQLEA